MKRTVFLGLRSFIISAVTAFSVIAFTGCGGEGEEPTADGAMATEQSSAGEAAANPENGSTADNPPPTENNAGGELQNLVSDGSGNAGALPPSGTPEASLDPTAAPADGGAGGDPFAAPADGGTAAMPSSDPFAPAASADPSASPLPADATASAAAVPPPADMGAAPAADPTAPAAPEAPAANVAAAAPSEPAPVAEAAQPAAAPVSESNGTTLSGGILPEKGSKMPYYIQRGDTLASIAQKIYGDKNKWKSLAEENNILNPSLIYAGDVLLYTLSEKSNTFAEKYEGAPRKTVKVEKGDSLSSIATKVLGSSASWRTLWKQNPQIKNPDVISVGMMLTYTSTTSVAENNSSEDSEVAVAELKE